MWSTNQYLKCVQEWAQKSPTRTYSSYMATTADLRGEDIAISFENCGMTVFIRVREITQAEAAA